MNYGLLGLGCFVAALFAGRYINERGLRKLDEKDQAALVGGLSRYRMISLIGVIAIVAVYLIFFGFSQEENSNVFLVFLSILLVYMLAGTGFVFVKMKQMKINEDYISMYLLSTTVQYLGMIVYFGLARWQ